MTRVFRWATNVLLVLVLAASLFVGQRQRDLRQEGSEAHDALCVFKADLERRQEDSRAFLAMTPEERVAKYGQQLGAIPPSVIRNSLANQQQTLDALADLDCA